MEPVDVRAHRVARRQHGYALRRQLLDDAGISPKAIRGRLHSGAWCEDPPGVIHLGAHGSSWRGRVQAIVLAAGPDAWASHGTAAYLHGFLDAPRPATPDVVVPRGRHPRVGETRLHTTRSLGADEVTSVHGIASTTAARTLLDLARGTAPPVLERYLTDRLRVGALAVTDLVELTDRHRRLPGRRRILEVAARLPGDVARLGSPLEVRGVQRLRELHAPPFELQYVVRDRGGATLKRVDVAWPTRRTILEFDGAAYHDLLAVRASDRIARDRMRALGWHVEVARRSDLDDPAFAGFVRRLRALG